MQILSSVLFALSASLDALLLGLSYGIRGISIRLWQNALVSLITLFGTCLSIALGALLLPFLPDSAASLLGAMALILLGGYYMSKRFLLALWQRAYTNSKTAPELQKNSIDDTKTSHLKEIIIIGILLSANNMGIGFSASIAGLPFLSTALATLLFSILLLFFGNRLGQSKHLQLPEPLADILSGALLVILGICQLVI